MRLFKSRPPHPGLIVASSPLSLKGAYLFTYVWFGLSLIARHGCSMIATKELVGAVPSAENSLKIEHGQPLIEGTSYKDGLHINDFSSLSSTSASRSPEPGSLRMNEPELQPVGPDEGSVSKTSETKKSELEASGSCSEVSSSYSSDHKEDRKSSPSEPEFNLTADNESHTMLGVQLAPEQISRFELYEPDLFENHQIDLRNDRALHVDFKDLPDHIENWSSLFRGDKKPSGMLDTLISIKGTLIQYFAKIGRDLDSSEQVLMDMQADHSYQLWALKRLRDELKHKLGTVMPELNDIERKILKHVATALTDESKEEWLDIVQAVEAEHPLPSISYNPLKWLAAPPPPKIDETEAMYVENLENIHNRLTYTEKLNAIEMQRFHKQNLMLSRDEIELVGRLPRTRFSEDKVSLSDTEMSLLNDFRSSKGYTRKLDFLDNIENHLNKCQSSDDRQAAEAVLYSLWSLADKLEQGVTWTNEELMLMGAFRQFTNIPLNLNALDALESRALNELVKSQRKKQEFRKQVEVYSLLRAQDSKSRSKVREKIFNKLLERFENTSTLYLRDPSETAEITLAKFNKEEKEEMAVLLQEYETRRDYIKGFAGISSVEEDTRSKVLNSAKKISALKNIQQLNDFELNLLRNLTKKELEVVVRSASNPKEFETVLRLLKKAELYSRIDKSPKELISILNFGQIEIERKVTEQAGLKLSSEEAKNLREGLDKISSNIFTLLIRIKSEKDPFIFDKNKIFNGLLKSESRFNYKALNVGFFQVKARLDSLRASLDNDYA